MVINNIGKIDSSRMNEYKILQTSIDLKEILNNVFRQTTWTKSGTASVTESLYRFKQHGVY